MFLAQTAVNRDRLRQDIFYFQSSESYDVNLFVVTNLVSHFARHIALLAVEELSTPFITIMVISIHILTTMWTLFFTLKFLKRYFSKLLAYIRDIFTVCFSFFIPIRNVSFVFRQSNTTSNAEESSNQADICFSNHEWLPRLSWMLFTN